MKNILIWIKKYYHWIVIGIMLLYILLFFLPCNFDTQPDGYSPKYLYYSVFDRLKQIISDLKIQELSFNAFKYYVIPIMIYLFGLAFIILDTLMSWRFPKKQGLFSLVAFTLYFIALCIGLLPDYANFLHIGFFIPIVVIVFYIAYFILSHLKWLPPKAKKPSDKERIAILEKEIFDLKVNKKSDD